MPAELQVQNTLGAPVTSVAFGYVANGTTSSPVTLTVKNIGDTAAEFITAQLVETSSADGGGIAVYEGTPIESAPVGIASTLGPDDSLTITVQFTFPSDAPPITLDTCTLRIQYI